MRTSSKREPGINIDGVSGEPLFAPYDKYESGCGWPGFIKPIERANVAQHSECHVDYLSQMEDDR